MFKEESQSKMMAGESISEWLAQAIHDITQQLRKKISARTREELEYALKALRTLQGHDGPIDATDRKTIFLAGINYGPTFRREETRVRRSRKGQHETCKAIYDKIRAAKESGEHLTFNAARKLVAEEEGVREQKLKRRVNKETYESYVDMHQFFELKPSTYRSLEQKVPQQPPTRPEDIRDLKVRRVKIW
ncbi:MAG: hypothetical protein R6U98_27180 [Pirellulaceae bacterium]